jgi:hypothetical protein
MKKAIISLFFFGSILCADTVQMSYDTVSSVVTVPSVNNDYAGPYIMDVNGHLVPGMCMDDFRGVNGTWTANVTNVDSSNLSNTVLGNTTFSEYGYTITSSQIYKMEAYLFSEIIQPNADRANLQLAAWALMDPNTLANVINSNNVTVENDELAAYNVVTNPQSGFNFGGYEILSDVDGKNQEFLVAAPEPSTYLLLGSGLIIAGALRFSRRRKGASVAV